MPYAVITNAEGCDGFAVVKKGETKPVDGGCHDTRVKAMAHMAALNMATADEMRYDPDQPRDADGKFGSGSGGGGAESGGTQTPEGTGGAKSAGKKKEAVPDYAASKEAKETLEPSSEKTNEYQAKLTKDKIVVSETGTRAQWQVTDKDGKHVGEIRQVRERTPSYSSRQGLTTNYYSQPRVRITKEPKNQKEVDMFRTLMSSRISSSKDAAVRTLIESHNRIIAINNSPEQNSAALGMEERATPNLVAPSFMKASARRGLALHEEGESGEGLKPATVADARRMVEGTALSEDKWRRIAPWIARHIVDLDAVQGDEITPGLVAMLLWGGGSSKESARRAQAYAERVVAQLDNEKRYDPDQPRDADGKFGSGSGGGDDDDLDEIDYDEFEAMVAEDEAAEAGGDTNDDDDSGGSDKPEWASDEDLGSRESADAAESKVIDEQKSYLADLPQVADEALQDYTGNGHRAVNRGLRGAPPPPLEGTAKENAIEQGEWINDAIQNAPPLTSDAVVFRGMSMEALGIDPTAGGIDRQLDNLVGSSYRDDGIISTSFEREVAADFAMSAGDIKVAVLVPKGSSALAVGALSQSYQERELLLPAGTEFEIVGLSGQGRGRTLYVEARTP